LEVLAAIIVILLAAAAFAVWVCVRLVGWVVGGVARMVRGPQDGIAAAPPAAYPTCPQPRCQAANVPHARFCRRCGNMVSGAPGDLPSRQPAMRYVA
jgi:hypothetical protein